MDKLPIMITRSSIPFALQGRTIEGFQLLVISDTCPLGLRNAMPRNNAGKFHGRLSSSWINFLFRKNYNWAYSSSLPKIASEYSEDRDQNTIEFQADSQLQFCWKSHSSEAWRAKVQKQLDRQKLDLCKAIIANDDSNIANILSPIILACEGYSV